MINNILMKIVYVLCVFHISATQLFAYTEITSYEYDQLNRLVSAQSDTGYGQFYDYDDKHNRIMLRTEGLGTADSEVYVFLSKEFLQVMENI